MGSKSLHLTTWSQPVKPRCQLKQPQNSPFVQALCLHREVCFYLGAEKGGFAGVAASRTFKIVSIQITRADNCQPCLRTCVLALCTPPYALETLER